MTVDAPVEVIQAAFKALIRHCHPDCGGQHSEAVLLNRAREVLTDPVQRAEYDRTDDVSAGSVVIQCPHCHSRNRVSASGDLNLRQVRCGRCRQLFIKKLETHRPQPEDRSEATGSFVASGRGRCFHRADCPYAGKIRRSSGRYTFEDFDEAADATNDYGDPYFPCPTCIGKA